MESQTMEVNTFTDYLILALFEALGTAMLTIAMFFGYKDSPDIICTGLFAAIVLTKRITGSHLSAGITLAVSIIEKANEDKKKMKIAATYLIG